MSYEYLSNTSYDTLILGTGMTESVIAAALSRAGERIIHLDCNDFYGDTYASLTLDQFHNKLNYSKNQMDSARAANNQSTEESSIESSSNDSANDEFIEGVGNRSFVHQPMSHLPHEKVAPLQYNDPIELNSELSLARNDDYVQYCKNERQSRLFAIDLQSKIIFASGDVVQLLIDSGVGRYTEYKGVDAVLIYMNKKWNNVPCSKGEIFKSKLISLKDKRYLTKFMKTCLDETLIQQLSEEEQSMSFVQYLRVKHQLSEHLIQLICFSIVLLSSLDDKITVKEGMERVNMYLRSIGRYGSTSFLYPVYGVSELPQAFCRVGAIFGGVYILRRSVQNVVISEKEKEAVTVSGVQCSLGQKLNVKRIIHSSSYKMPNATRGPAILRCVSITSFPILDPYHYKNHSNPRQMYHPHNGILLMIVPPHTFGNEQSHSITITQLDSTSRVCPSKTYMLSFQTKCQNYGVLKQCVDFFLNNVVADETSGENGNVPEQQDENHPDSEDSSKLNNENLEESNSSENTISESSQTNLDLLEGHSVDQKENFQKSNEIENIPRTLHYQVFYSYKTTLPKDEISIENMICVKDTFDSIHCEDSIREAKNIFKKIYPNQSFLTEIPNPEDSQIYDEDAKILGVDEDLEAQ